MFTLSLLTLYIKHVSFFNSQFKHKNIDFFIEMHKNRKYTHFCVDFVLLFCYPLIIKEKAVRYERNNPGY